MRKLLVFTQISLDGYFCDARGDMSWAHNRQPDPEFDAYVRGNAQGGGVLLFGRVTYEMMASFWPTPQAREMNPVVAEAMNSMEKFVVSRTLKETAWSHTTLLHGDLVEEVRKLKAQPGPGIAILGSGSLVVPLTKAGLIDEYQTVINPIAIGAGRTIFDGLDEPLNLKPTLTRTFANGNVVVNYEPA